MENTQTISTPWRQLKCDNRRKLMNLSFSFLELGASALTHGAGWFTPVCVRHTMIREVVGGWSHMLRQYLRLHLCGSSGISTAGISVTLNGKPVLLFAKLTHLLADCDGFQSGLAWKGTSSTKPCIRHWNVLMKRSPLRTQDGFVDISCADWRCFKSASHTDIMEYIDFVHLAQEQADAGLIPKSSAQEASQVCGFNVCPNGVLACRELREHFAITDVLTSDWMHNALQDGMLTLEVFLFLAEAAVPRETLEEYMKTTFAFPRSTHVKSSELHRIFNEYRFSEARFRCSASEMLSLYGLLRHFVATEVEHTPALTAQRASFLAACKVLDILMGAKRREVRLADAGRALRFALSEHMRLHLTAYEDQYIKPKHHLMFDIAEQMIRDGSKQQGILLDMFVVERTHLEVKKVATNIENTRTFEASVLAALLNRQTNSWQEHAVVHGLLGRVQAFPGMPSVQCSRSLRIDGATFSVGDLAMYGDKAGAIVACVRDAFNLFVLVQELVFEHKLSTHSAIWRFTDSYCFWSARCVLPVLAWIPHADQSTTVIRM